ncbi:MAG: CRISPR-associated endonuclease Cas1 [Xenococcaceae cyanobacterium]
MPLKGATLPGKGTDESHYLPTWKQLTEIIGHKDFLFLADSKQAVRLAEISLVVVLPGVQMTDVAIAQLLDRGIETLFLTQNWQFRGRLQGKYHTNPRVRLAQYRTVETTFAMALAQKLVRGKIHNQRTLLQRKNRAATGGIRELGESIELMGAYLEKLKNFSTPLNRNEMMGIEGICAKAYYQALHHYFPVEWNFSGRNRRPPRDPINALLSWGYGVLLARIFAACVQGGLDPYLGFFHAIEPYRPNLALDLMEEFRPVVVDQALLSLIRENGVRPEDFELSADGEGIWLGKMAKTMFLIVLERRLQETFLYPSQGRRLSLSQIFVEQARWIARCLMESSLDYEAFMLR